VIEFMLWLVGGTINEKRPINVTASREFVPCQRAKHNDPCVLGIEAGQRRPQLRTLGMRSISASANVAPVGAETAFQERKPRLRFLHMELFHHAPFLRPAATCSSVFIRGHLLIRNSPSSPAGSFGRRAVQAHRGQPVGPAPVRAQARGSLRRRARDPQHYQPSNVADLVHCQEFETAKPHGVFTLATHHIRQAEAIKAGIKRLIAARDHALGRPAPAAIPRGMD
jgi:hypothetical protein